ncbi:efflux RND transporter periplasmic adaptor subunit [Rhizobium lusitanum]|uniref:Efflux RND transporter periplasmic adaptor subunit n=1 Tax=Rhizobium lusitanum TaxID=293958 RepID=A0A6L9UCW0_9HYPH|nr:efflux RND transporter periplasmic adaptor subunit [Rhizobium lusitanum]NEI72036.1 efflux RND transporter periplasmic adaptor subunit [Rhizobium lusitanum]
MLSLTLALLLAGAAHDSARAQTPPGGPPPTVGTAPVKLAPVEQQGQYVGTVVPIQQVNLVARVEGVLESVNFAEGSFIKAGSTVLEIEKAPYEAALASAQAQLQSARANETNSQVNLNHADINLKRQTELLTQHAVAQSAVDDATATRDSDAAQVEQAKAAIAQADAQVKTAQLNLGYTQVVSPISGRVGKLQITAGNLVSSSSGTLATVVQSDPIRVAFSIADRDYLKVIDMVKPNDQGFGGSAAEFQPKLKLSDGTDYQSPGKIAFIDNTIDPSTGTIAVFADFPNPHLQLVSGQYVQVTVAAGEPRQLPVVPAAAVQQDQDGAFVFVLDEGNRAVIRRVTLGQRVGTDWATPSGLAAGETIIVSGIQKIRAGMTVSPTSATVGN